MGIWAWGQQQPRRASYRPARSHSELPEGSMSMCVSTKEKGFQLVRGAQEPQEWVLTLIFLRFTEKQCADFGRKTRTQTLAPGVRETPGEDEVLRGASCAPV